MSTPPLRERIEQDMKAALRAGDRARLGTLRLIRAAIQQREVDERTTLDDAQVLQVLDKLLKQRRDAVEQYRRAGREELAAREEAEIAVIQAYLPQPLSEEELDRLIAEALEATGASGPRDMGKVMAALRPRVQGRADMAEVSRRVKARLAG